MFKKKNSTGMTLIEMMLALMLGTLMMSALFEIFLIAENNRLTETTLITFQENIQFINTFFNDHIKASNYFGCAKLTEDFPFKNNLPFDLNSKNRIMSYEEAESKTGTDAIRIWYASAKNNILLKKMTNDGILYSTSSLFISVNDNLIISDCKTAESFRVKEVTSLEDGTLKIIPYEPLSKEYDVNSEINQLEIESYFIGKTDRLDNNQEPIYALFLKDSQDTNTELIEGISEMKIFFSTIMDNQLIELPIQELNNSNEITGLSFNFNLKSTTNFQFQKNGNVYVALF